MERFSYTKVITRNFIQDFINSVRNFLGADLPNYEERINGAIRYLYGRIDDLKITWYRLEITEITDGAVAIIIYGEYK